MPRLVEARRPSHPPADVDRPPRGIRPRCRAFAAIDLRCRASAAATSLPRVCCRASGQRSLAPFLNRDTRQLGKRESQLRKGAILRLKLDGRVEGDWRARNGSAMGLRALRRLYRPSLPALPCSTHAVLLRPLQIYCTLFLAIATYGQLSNRFSGITRNNLQRGVVGKGAGQARRRRAREQRADGGTQRRRQAFLVHNAETCPQETCPQMPKRRLRGPLVQHSVPKPTLGRHFGRWKTAFRSKCARILRSDVSPTPGHETKGLSLCLTRKAPTGIPGGRPTQAKVFSARSPGPTRHRSSARAPSR
jgi:hypothetical protein